MTLTLEERFDLFKKANPTRFKKVEADGKKYMKDMDARNNKQQQEPQIFYASTNPNDINYVNPTWIDFDEDDYNERFKMKQQVDAEREVKLKAESEAQERMNAMLDYKGDVKEEELLPF